MKNFFIKNRLGIIIFLFFSFIYFFVRFITLKHLPIFVDEAIYVHWAQLGKYYPAMRFASLADGIQPLYMWSITLLMNFFPNPLLAGRLISIISGYFTLLGLYVLSYELFHNKVISFLTIILYIFYPFALVMNRLAIYETLNSMWSIWSFYLTIILIKRKQVGIAFTLGFFLGASVLTKTSGFINIYFIPFFMLLFKKEKMQGILRLVLLIVLAIALSYLSYSVLQLSENYYQISEKTYLNVYHVGELIPYHAFQKMWGNILMQFLWIIQYLTLPLALIFLSIPFVGKKFTYEKLLLFLRFIIPVIALAFIGRKFNPRYIYSMTLFLLPLLGMVLYNLHSLIRNRLLYICIVIITACFIFYSDFKIVTDFAHSPIPEADAVQYINGKDSGGGVSEIISYLLKESSRGPLVIVTEGSYGSLTKTVVEIYFMNNQAVENYTLDTIASSMPSDLVMKARNKPVYIILNTTQDVPKWPIQEIMNYRKGSSNFFIRLYKVRNHSDTPYLSS